MCKIIFDSAHKEMVESKEIYYWKGDDKSVSTKQTQIDKEFEKATCEGDDSLAYGYSFGEFADCVCQLQAAKQEWKNLVDDFKKTHEQLVNKALLSKASGPEKKLTFSFTCPKGALLYRKMLALHNSARKLFEILFPDADNVKFEQLVKIPPMTPNCNIIKHLVSLLMIPSRVSFVMQQDNVVVFSW